RTRRRRGRIYSSRRSTTCRGTKHAGYDANTIWRPDMNRAILSAVAMLASAIPIAPAAAQVPEIRLARQFSMGYLQFNVMEHEKLIEKHARALGLPGANVSWDTFNGPDAMNSALIAGRVDIVAGGMPGLITIWGRTRGTSNEVRGVAAFSSQPIWLNTRNPDVKSIADLGDNDRVAVPAVKVSIQA